MHHDPDDLGRCADADEVDGDAADGRRVGCAHPFTSAIGAWAEPTLHASGGAQRSYQATRALRLLTIVASQGRQREKEKEQEKE